LLLTLPINGDIMGIYAVYIYICKVSGIYFPINAGIFPSFFANFGLKKTITRTGSWGKHVRWGSGIGSIFDGRSRFPGASSRCLARVLPLPAPTASRSHMQHFKIQNHELEEFGKQVFELPHAFDLERHCPVVIVLASIDGNLLDHGRSLDRIPCLGSENYPLVN